jgi:hypothetical protein
LNFDPIYRICFLSFLNPETGEKYDVISKFIHVALSTKSSLSQAISTKIDFDKLMEYHQIQITYKRTSIVEFFHNSKSNQIKSKTKTNKKQIVRLN